MARRVVVTGLGTVNPLGMDVESFWKAAQAGTSGIGLITAFDTKGFKVHIGGEITAILDCHLDRHSRAPRHRLAQLAQQVAETCLRQRRGAELHQQCAHFGQRAAV